MNRFLPIQHDEIVHFDSAAGLLVKAIFKPDPKNTSVFQVWLLPERGEAFTPEILKSMGVAASQLAQLFDPTHCSSRRAWDACRLQNELSKTFAPELEHYVERPVLGFELRE